MDVRHYDMRIDDRNTQIRWDNSLDESLAVKYTPHAMWETYDRTPATDGSGNPVGTATRQTDEGAVGKMAHADFMTSRILIHDNAADDATLSITNNQTGVEVVRVNLPDLLSRLTTWEDAQRYSKQEFLDRGYDYQLDFFLKNDRLAYVYIRISVLGWAVRWQPVEL